MNARLTSPAPPPLVPVGRPLDDGWRQWVAENRLRGCTPDSMLASMTRSGLDTQASLTALRDIEINPVYLAAVRHRQVLRKLQSVTGNLQKLWESAADYTVVEKREQLSRAEFEQRYACGCRPVVITGLAREWPALKRWSAQYLKRQFGHLEVEVQAERQADPAFEQDKLLHRRLVRLGDFADQVLANGPSNDQYLTANNELLRRPEFASLLQDIGPLPDYCDAARLADSCSFWFGPAGTVTPLHHDTLMLFHTQVVGRKRWRFISPLETPRLYNYFDVYSPVDIDQPDLSRYPDFGQVKVLDVVVEPGETVFLPLGWWHQVSALDMSLSFSFSNPAVPNVFSYTDPDIRNW